MKLATANGNFLIFNSGICGAAVYYGFEKVYLNSDETPSEKKKIIRIVRDGQCEYDWALKNWGVEPQELEYDEDEMLLFAFQKIRKAMTLAIKNPKSESSILSESEFFKTNAGLLIARAKGTTYRRVHQGSNGWSLFTIEGDLPSRPEEIKREPWIDFGTYNGVEENIKWLYESDLIPISKMEWEEISGRKFVAEHEFSWFKGCIERYVLDPEQSLYEHRVAKNKKSAEMAGYRYFMPVKDLLISVETGEIDNRFGADTLFPKSVSEIEFLEKDNRYEKIYHYSLYCRYFSRSSFKIRNYTLSNEGLYVSTSDAGVYFILKGSAPGGTETNDEILYLSNSSWERIKSTHPHWVEYGDGVNNYSPKKDYNENYDHKNKKSSFALGDLQSLQNLKEKLA